MSFQFKRRQIFGPTFEVEGLTSKLGFPDYPRIVFFATFSSDKLNAYGETPGPGQVERNRVRKSMPANTTELEKRLWGAADELRANSKLKSSEYSVPVLGLIFLSIPVDVNGHSVGM